MVDERFLLRAVERERVALRVEGDDAHTLDQVGRGGGAVELDAHLAEDAYGAIADRLEQAAGCGVDFVDAVLDPVRAAGGRIPFERARE